MPLFRIVQASGKERLISDARKGKHNEMVTEEETIYVPSADFIPEALRVMYEAIAKGPWSEGEDAVASVLPDVG